MSLLDASISARVGARVLFSDLGLRLARGEVLWLTGASGSGKSTALRVLAGLIPPERGWVRWFGADVEPPDWPSIRARAILVPQRPRLGRGTLCEALREPLRFKVHDERVWDERRARVELDAVRLNAGLLDTACDRLSEGERLRGALVRALLVEPDVLLLDEPTAALDPTSRGALLERLVGYIARGGSMILVTHDTEAAQRLGARAVNLEAHGPQRAA